MSEILGQKRFSSPSEKSPKKRKLLGPASTDATLCADARDPVSLQEIWRANSRGEKEASDEISLLFSYEERHSDGRVYLRGFALESLAQMIDRAKDERNQEVRHPVSGIPIPAEALERAELLIKQHGISGERVDLGAVSEEELTEEKMGFFALEIFQLLATIDIRVDEGIFMSLSTERLTRLAFETREMIEANISVSILDILKADNEGRRPFTPLPKIPTINSLRQFVLREFRRIFIKTESIDKSQLRLIVYVIVGALATVCPEIRRNYYDSLVFNFDLSSESSATSSAADFIL